MERENDRFDTFSRRAVIIGVGQGIILSLLGGRLAWLQIAEGEKYKTLSEANRINIKIIPPMRGQIVDRFGIPLADNVQDFQVIITPEQVDNLENALRQLRKVVTIEDRDIKRVLRDVKRNPKFMPIQVRNHLTWDEVSTIEVNLPYLPGTAVQSGEVRSYPHKDATAHLVGYVGRVAENDMTADKLLRMPGFQIGKNGLEKQYEMQLRGQPGKAEVEVNVHGREVRQLGKTPAITGDKIVLSIDAELQRFVQQRLAAERSASAVIMDVHTGAVYALASYPSFDPNSFTGGISTMEWEQLRDDPTHPLINKIISGLYPPGSTFKIVTGLAGLEAGVIDANWGANCPGHYEFGGHRFHCWKPGGHGGVNLVRALAVSCDVYFYKMSSLVGIDRIADMARRLGLGDKLDIGLPEEKAGLVPDTKWKRKARKEKWHPGETIVAAIGQGYLQTTPLQLATMAARTVNGGKAVKPWLTGIIGGQEIHTKPWEDLGLNPAHLDLIKQGMAGVMAPGGTAYAHRISEPGMEMGGKTGTSQVKRITMAERAAGRKTQEQTPWQYRHHGLFVGYAPLSNPRYAVSVVVEHGGGGSSAAAPIAKDIMLECERRDPASKEMKR